ncbi:MAG: glycosyltransferase family 4 protein [candidate division Zixibacteria bacterium]
MKILMLTYEFPPVSGGIATYTAGLALAASKSGHDITIAVSGTPREFDGDITDYPFIIVRYGTGNYTFGKLPRLLWRTYRLVERGGFDLIHALDWPHIMALAYFNRFKKIPFVASVYGTEILLAPDSRQIKYLAGENFFTAPDRFYAISDYTRNLLLETKPTLDPESVTATPPGVDFDYFSNPGEKFDIYKRFSIPINNKVILTVSRLDKRKGHRAVFRALERLPSRMKNEVSYIIAGDGDDSKYNQELRRLAKNSGVNVIFAGRVDYDLLPSLYASCDLFCMPGEPYPEKIEGFGIVYLEAAAAGLPSIASRIGGVPEAVIDNRTGILLEPGDIESLSAALVKMIRNDDFRAGLGKAAFEHAKQFSWQRCAELTYSVANRN